MPDPGDSVADVTSAIDSLHVRIIDSYRMGAADSLAALYHENATILVPNTAAVQGREAVRARWQTFFTGYDWDVGFERLFLASDGDLAVEQGRYTITMTAERTQIPIARDRGNYLVVWQRTAAGWRVRYDVGISDSPRKGSR